MDPMVQLCSDVVYSSLDAMFYFLIKQCVTFMRVFLTFSVLCLYDLFVSFCLLVLGL